jgi:hypothetical protein
MREAYALCAVCPRAVSVRASVAQEIDHPRQRVRGVSRLAKDARYAAHVVSLLLMTFGRAAGLDIYISATK